MNEALRGELGALDVGEVVFDESLAPHTAFRTGGPVEARIHVPDVERWGRLLAWARQRKVPVIHLGRGCGLLVRGTGLAGLAITTRQLSGLRRVEDEADGSIRIRAEAGTSLREIAAMAAREGAGDLDEWVGCEGTVGGALRRCWPRMRPRTVAVGLLGDRGRPRMRSREEIGELLRLPGRTAVAWATLEFPVRSGESLFDDRRFTMDDATVKRGENRGTIRLFLDPEGEVASSILADLGVRGIRLREVAIDDRDPNRARNLGEGTTEDLQQLVEYVQKRASQRGGVDLAQAFRIVGKK